MSVNFHPFFRNEDEPVKKKTFYTNYVDVNLPVNIFTQESKYINKVNLKYYYSEYFIYTVSHFQATMEMLEYMRKDADERPADFIVVGPLTEESQIITGLIE